jgi:type III secretion protein L
VTITEGEVKLFSMIDGHAVTLAPGTKRLPADAFSTLLSCAELLETTKKDAEEYRKKVSAECEELKTHAEIEGFQAGFDQWTQTVSYLEGEIAKVQEELQKVVMPVALKAARKIVAAELDVNPNVVLDIVASTLKSIAQHKRIVLYVSKKDFDLIESSKSKLKPIFEELESLSVRDREDIEPGGCVVETEVGIVNARLKDRWRTLEAALEHIASAVTPEKKKEGS